LTAALGLPDDDKDEPWAGDDEFGVNPHQDAAEDGDKKDDVPGDVWLHEAANIVADTLSMSPVKGAIARLSPRKPETGFRLLSETR
jgi:hypothetical protein